MTEATPSAVSSAAGVCWNLGDLYPRGADDPQLEADLAEALRRATAFADRYRGRILVPGGPSPELLLSACREFEAIDELVDRPACFAGLQHAAKTDLPEHGRLLTRTREAGTEVAKHLIFFDLEWGKLADADARRLIEHPMLTPYRNWLVVKRSFSPYDLSEPEEKVLKEKAVTGRAAFVRLFNETTSSLECPYTHAGQSESVPLQSMLAKLYDADRSVRKAAHAGITEGLRRQSRLLTYIFNTVVADHASDCRLRNYPTVMTAQHLSNEIDEAAVDALMTACEKFHPTVHRYYRLKARLLGVHDLADYDRYAPIGGSLPTMSWSDAQRVVTESYTAFDTEAGRIVREFFDKRWIDAELRTGKKGGAFSHGCVPSCHPYILMNWTDKLRDAMTLAHELGHGLHQYLSRQVGHLQAGTPLTTAETASVFGEMLTFRRLLELHTDPQVRLSLLCSKIEDAFSTAFRQICMTRFEQNLHTTRRERGELSAEQIDALWLEANRPMFGEALCLTPEYGRWWSYIHHFINVPFYCYAYAFGLLLVMALYQRYQQEGASFVPKYLDVLSRGRSEPPPVLVARMGLDITDARFWELGLQLLDDMVGEAEKAAG